MEAWAEKDPTKFKEAVNHWVLVRRRLEPIKNKLPEYYEVMLSIAKCLMREAETTKDKAKSLKQAKDASSEALARLAFEQEVLDAPACQ